MTKTTKQKFFRGDVVRVAKELPQSMSHFHCDFTAVILGSYFDMHGKGTDSCFTDYAVMDAQTGLFTAWYPESVLTLTGSMSEREIHALKLKYNGL